MLLRLEILGILFIIQKTKAYVENNITLSSDQLKTKFGCIPLEAWNMMKIRHYDIEVVCRSNDYEAGNAPDEISMNPIIMEIRDNNTIIDIDEKGKTLTMEIRLRCIWRDERIRAAFPEHSAHANLQTVTAERKPTFWIPFDTLQIENVKKRRYILDPVIADIGLVSIKYANNILSRNNSTNSYTTGFASIVQSHISWEVTVSCPFDYSNFPFDAHKCPLKMKFPFGWNLAVFNNQKGTSKYYLDGFETELHDLAPNVKYYKDAKLYKTTFGFGVHAKRQISKYVYQYYLPSITIVIASSVSFIVPLSAIPGRVSLVVTLFLTLTNIFIHHMVSDLALYSF